LPQVFIDATETEEADSNDYQKLSTSDDDPWVTEFATKNGEYDAQLYKFKISEDPRRISSLSVEWEGRGEPYEGYETEIYIWNFEKGQWELLSSRDRMTSDEWLGDKISANVMDYVSDGYVYVLARAEAAYATLTGYVKDSSTGSGISGATVSIAGKSTITDSSGRYTIIGLRPGTYTVSASASGYSSYSKTITLEPGTNHHDISLSENDLWGGGEK